jgi:protein-ribulosamine 3-kinase
MQLVDKYPPKTSIESSLDSSKAKEDGKIPSVIAPENEAPTDELAQLKVSETVVS